MTKRRLKRAIERLRKTAASDLSTKERHRQSLLAYEHDSSELDKLLGASRGDQSATYTINWREAAPEDRPDGISWDATMGTLIYDLWDGQRQCLESLETGSADIVAFLGGYGTGKSVLGARWLIATALDNPRSRFLAMAQDFSKGESSTFRKLFEQLPGERTGVFGGSGRDPEQSPIVADYNRSDHRLTLINDTEVWLGSADRTERYAGAEFSAVWLDEPSHYQTDLHDLLEMVSSRLRGVDGPKVQCWTLTGNGYNDAWEILVTDCDNDWCDGPVSDTLPCFTCYTINREYDVSRRTSPPRSNPASPAIRP